VRVWIDVDNAPHVQIFRPIIQRLRERGAEIAVTARDRTYVPELLQAAGIPHTIIGRGQPKGVAAKAAALAGRTAALARYGARGRFDVAVGHGSRSLPPAARLSGTPNLTMFDYEHVSTWLFRSFCDRILIPRAVAGGLAGRRPRGPWRSYDGYKEEIYLADFTPDATIRSRLGIAEEEVLVVVRPPSRTAHYHDAVSEALLEALTRRIAGAPEVHAVWLRRDASEPVPESARAANILVPEAPLDGLSLLAAADLAVSGGGTMNREAALLGTPAYSIFTGPAGALDQELIRAGRLVAVREPSGIRSIPFAKKELKTPPAYDGGVRELIVDHIWDLGTGRAHAVVEGRKRWAFPS
jgi:predicted glycosyltransferase